MYWLKYSAILHVVMLLSCIFSDMLEAVSRGLDNTGRVYARSGEFDKAIDV